MVATKNQYSAVDVAHKKIASSRAEKRAVCSTSYNGTSLSSRHPFTESVSSLVGLFCEQFLPAWTCKLLVGHKADLPAYVVNDEALSLYVAGASGFKGWCLTVGSSEYGDYDVAARSGFRF